MKSLLSVVAALLALSACVSPPVADFAAVESACGQQCAANHTKCVSGFKLFPIANEMACKTTVETCVKACPPRGATTVAQKPPKERLAALDEALNAGLITKAEYDTKRAEIIGSM